ncbi:MAG TPA: caspase family protein [Vicinamibacterales bacterium]
MISRSLATLVALALLTAPMIAGQSESDDLSTIRGRKLTIVKDNTGAQAVTGVPRGYALIVGVSNYKNLDSKRQLRFAESDAQSIYRLLISKEAGAFPPENVHLLTGAKATLQNIKYELETWLPSVAQPSDRVIVFFAGHGLVDKGRGYLAPYDVDPGNVDATAYSMATAGEVIGQRIKSRWKVLLADACHSAKINVESTNESIGDAFSKMPANFLTLTATTEREASHEDSALSTGFGLFTYFLEQAWSGNADNDPCDGRITADELVEYVRTNVREYARRRNLFQTPTARGDYDPQMLLGVSLVCLGKPARDPDSLLGTAVVEVNLDEVTLYIDGKLIGPLKKDEPLTVPRLTTGPHEFKGVRQGYEPDVKQIIIAPGQTVPVTLRIRYQRVIKKSAIELNQQGERLLNTQRSAMNPLNILPVARKQDQKDLLRARDLFTRALEDDPKYPEAAYHLGEVNQLLDEQAASLKALQRAIDIDPSYIEARTQHAALLIETGDTDEAIRELTDALRLDPKNDGLHAMLARAYFDRGSWSNVVEAADKAVALNDANDQAQLWRADALRQLAVKEKDSARQKRLFTDARDGYRAFVSLTNFESSAASLIAFHFIGHGIGGRKHADRTESFQALRTAAFSGLCITENRVGNRLRAREYCERALTYDKANPITYFLLGNINRDLYNDYASCDYILAASRNYDKMVSINPDLQESKNARLYLEQISGILPKLGCKGV